MALLRRLAQLASMLICVSVAFTAAAITGEAQGPGGGFLPAGNYSFITTRAGLNLFPADPSQSTVNLFIIREQGTSRPLVGPSSTSNVTTLNLTVNTNFGFGTPNGSACVVLDNPADFTVSSGVQSASLHTTITTSTSTAIAGSGVLRVRRALAMRDQRARRWMQVCQDIPAWRNPGRATRCSRRARCSSSASGPH